MTARPQDGNCALVTLKRHQQAIEGRRLVAPSPRISVTSSATKLASKTRNGASFVALDGAGRASRQFTSLQGQRVVGELVDPGRPGLRRCRGPQYELRHARVHELLHQLRC